MELAIRDPPPVPAAHLSAATVAVSALSRRATAGAVAARTGLSLPDAERALHELARRAQADVLVTSSGDVAYAFRPGFSAALRARSLRERAAALAGPLRTLSLRAARVAFGLALVASVAVVALGLAAVAAEGGGGGERDDGRDDGGRRRRRGGARGPSGVAFGGGSPYGYGYGYGYASPGSLFGSPFFRFDLSDLIYLWDPFYQKRAALYRDAFLAPSRGARSARRRGGKGGGGGGGGDRRDRDASCETPRGFLEAATSVVWGDGDPNADLSARRWSRVAEAIAARDGVVTAEELAPLLDGGAGGEGEALEALVRFGGEAVVTDGGELLYDFPRLREEGGGRVDRRGETPWRDDDDPAPGGPGRRVSSPSSRSPHQTASSPSSPPLYPTASSRSRAPPAPLVEELHRMTRATHGQALAVAALAAANALGVAALATLAGAPAGRLALARRGLGWLPALLPFLELYAASYVVVPLARALGVRRANAGVRARNAARLEAFRRLAHPDARLRAKLAGAAKLAAGARNAAKREDYQSMDDVIWGTNQTEGAGRTRGGAKGPATGGSPAAPTGRRTDRAPGRGSGAPAPESEREDPLGAMRDFDRRLREAQREREGRKGARAQREEGGKGPGWLFWGKGEK